MYKALSEVMDLTADDEGWTRTIMEWIKSYIKDLRMTKSFVGSSIHLEHSSISQNILDPISSNKKKAPRKFRRKSSLESSSKRVNVLFLTSSLIENLKQIIILLV